MCGAGRFDRWRAQAAEGLLGRVVEIGFGSGLNVPHYPSDVEVILAVEPAVVAWRMAAGRIAASPVRVSRIGLDGQDLPLRDASCDAALFTFTLCTVPEPEKALSELRRVVRPGGTIHFAEHGLSPEAGVAKWQHRIEPLRCALVGGCHLTRDPSMLVERAGFVMERNEQGYARGPKPSSWLTLGVASNPGA
jgi:ubiquinone/menaquinone biosynthesis C-methylase UbiE